MNKIKKLANASYTRNELDVKKVLAIAKYLSKKDLREYIKNLKLIEDKKTVTITVADVKSAKSMISTLSDKFKGKKVEIEQDKSLIAGARVLDYDTVYEYDLKSKIDDITNSLGR